MSAIGPGDWVECIRDSATNVGQFRAGQVYRCVATPPKELPCRVCEEVHTGLQLANAPSPLPADWLWPICCFKPIYRPRADFLESLLTPADAPSEREGVDA